MSKIVDLVSDRDGLPVCKLPGVYKILCIKTGKYYIGSAINIRGRLSVHRKELRRGIHGNSYLQRAWNKYKEHNFRFEAVEVCVCTKEKLRTKLRSREQHYLDTLKAADRKCGYNICCKVESWQGCKHSEETKRRWSEQRKGKAPMYATIAAAEATRGKPRPQEVREAISKKNKGQKRTPEQIANIIANHWSKRPDAKEIAARAADKQRGVPKHTEEHKAKLRLHRHSEETKRKISRGLQDYHMERYLREKQKEDVNS